MDPLIAVPRHVGIPVVYTIHASLFHSAKYDLCVFVEVFGRVIYKGVPIYIWDRYLGSPLFFLDRLEQLDSVLWTGPMILANGLKPCDYAFSMVEAWSRMVDVDANDILTVLSPIHEADGASRPFLVWR
jgi:hypothetical protein